MEQQFPLDDFWSRYGKTDFDQTDFTKALSRLPGISEAGPWVAGGSVRRLIAGQKQDSDFDFFFRDEAQFSKFCEDMKARGAKRASESDFNVTFRLPAAEAVPVEDGIFEGGGPELKVQAICIAYFETISDCIQSFDFSICQFGFDGAHIVCGQWALFDLANRRLVPGKLTYGASSLRRMIKYTRQGFTICGGGLANMLEQVVADPSIIRSEVEYVD